MTNAEVLIFGAVGLLALAASSRDDWDRLLASRRLTFALLILLFVLFTIPTV